MKKFNLFSEIIVANHTELLNTINSNQEFGITHKGDIVTDFNSKERHIYIYKGRISIETPSALKPTSKPKSLNELFGPNYQIVVDEERVLIKAGAAWQDIIAYNTKSCDYDDTTGDGVAEFSDSELENIGWQATEFSVNYRSIVEYLEEDVKIDGLLLCIEQIEPYQFSGLGYIFDYETARTETYNFCQNIVKNKLATDPDYKPSELNDDEEEAAKFFKAI